MNVIKRLEGSELFVDIEGNIDSVTAPDLNASLNESLKGVSSIVFDFKKVDYISSAGLRVLLVAVKAMPKDGNVTIRNANSNVMDIFEMTGFVNILTIER